MTEDSHNAAETVPVDAHNQYQQYPPNEGPTGGNGNGNGNGNGHTSAVIELELTEEVQKEEIVTTCFYSFKSKSMTFKLNHKYQNKLIDLPVDLNDLKQTSEEFRDILKSNGVTTDDITKLENMFISNNKRIVHHYYQQMLEQTNTGQRAKKERIERIKNTPPREVSVAQALMMKDGNVRVNGKIIGGSPKVENVYKRIGFWCGDCDHINILADYSDRPRLTSEIPHIFGPKYLSKHKCKKGCEGTFANSPYEDTISARHVELHETETSNDPPIMNVILFNNCAMDVPYVEQVKITGSIQRVKIKDKLLPHLFVGLESDDSTTNDLNPIECPDKIELVVITPDDEKEIQEFVIQNNGRVLDALADLVEPSHIGHEDAKKGLLMSAASTGINTKRRINVLLIGETGEAKTPLAKGSTRLVPGSKFASATDSTTNSLICVVDNETRHFRIGPVVTSNRAILVIDEIGRMPKDEQARLLSAMQEGTINFARFGIARELEASPGFVLTSNPDSISGKFRYQDKIDPNEFPFLGPFRDRIDLIFIFRTNRKPEHLRNYGFNKLEVEDNHIAYTKKEGENYQYLRKHVLYSKKFDPSKFSSTAAKCRLIEYYTNVMSSENSLTSPRLLDTLYNLCYVVARLKLKNTIDEEDVKEVIEFYNKQLKYWSQIKADVPPDPRDLAYQEIIKKLNGHKFAVEFEQLLQAVCKDNIYVDRYTMKLDEKGERDWNVRTNHKVRYIREKFNKASRDERVLILNRHPLTLAWSETYTGGDKPIDADIIDSDVGDASDVAGKHSERNTNSSNDNTNTITKPKISNEGVNPDVTNVTKVTESGKRSEIPKIADKDPLEDYEAYIARQTEKVRAIEKEEQQSTARKIFDELVLKNAEIGMEKEVLESKFREELASGGFSDHDINIIIKYMENGGFVERVATESDGVIHDIIRKR